MIVYALLTILFTVLLKELNIADIFQITTMPDLTANDLKTRGVAAIESLLATQPEAFISVRGQERYVVMDVAQYHYLRECELDAALAQSRADVAAGRAFTETASEHMARLETLLASNFVAPTSKKPRTAKASSSKRSA